MNGVNIVLSNRYYEEYPENEPWVSQLREQKQPFVHVSEESHTFIRRQSDPLFFGKTGDIIFQTSLLVHLSDDRLFVEGDLQSQRIYLNRKRIDRNELAFQIGDTLFFEGIPVKIVIFENSIQIIGVSTAYKTRLLEKESTILPFENYHFYKRSPRMIKRVPTDKIEIKAPPQKARLSTSGLLQMILPPLAMALVSVGVGILIGRGVYLIISIAGAIITTVVALIKYINDRTACNETNQKRTKLYKEYLLRKRKELYQTYESEKEVYRYNYPDVTAQEELINSYHYRLYERRNTDDDFLMIAIGKQKRTVSFPIDVKESELSIENDELEEKARNLKDEFSIIVTERMIQLKNSHLGLIGNKKVIHEQLNAYVSQLVTFHSYHDLQIILIYDQDYEQEFKWMKWLPHTTIHGINMKGLIHSERVRDQLLNSLNQILKEREQILRDSKKEAQFVPHYLFIIDEPKLIMDHFIQEFLNQPSGRLDFSIIYTSYLQENLPENIETVLLLEDSATGRLLLEEKEVRNERVQLLGLSKVNLEKMARNLSTLTHVQGMASQIPEAISFFNLYKITHPEELDIRKRWLTNSSHKSLAVPLGVRAEEDIVSLNLHEKAHGPHGLIAGTTGSGKSEIVQSYILSLAVNFHPYEVGFLLIDYKGGGMASLFKDLPHLMGTITNLDGSESTRAMASIKSELSRRQRIFNRYEVNHINGYNALFKEGKVSEPLPHLFLISDEFAELKKEQPEFMQELVSASRIGRSLGVHLILATQKPSGVVDDQIWSNSKFKLALKVQNEADSKEVLKTPDAATIIQPGRAYLQVGNNEIYELFQSAWSGAPYIKEQEKEVTMDNRIYLVNDLGQGQLINQDLSGKKEEIDANETQLDVVVRYIAEEYQGEETAAIQRPWLPSLKAHIFSPLLDEKTYPHSLHEDLSIPLGLIDIPEMQLQESYIWNPLKDGNLAYIASSGYGKSFFLTTAALSLAARYSVAETYFYILDFGNNTLIRLKNLPHTAEYIGLDDDERYQKFKTLMVKEIDIRKKKFSQLLAQNIATYNQLSKEKLPVIIIMIDNYDAIKEQGFEEEEYFTKLTRDGAGLGIYFVITATRTNGIRLATFNNFKQRVAGVNFEPNEVTALVGRSPYKLPEVKGRGLLKHNELISVIQIYTMSKAADEISYIRDIQKIVEKIQERCAGESAPRIPILPEELHRTDFGQYTQDNSDIYLGLEKESVVLTGMDRLKTPFLIFGEPKTGKTHNLKIMLEQVLEKGQKVTLFDSKKLDLYTFKDHQKLAYMSDEVAFEEFLSRLEEEVQYREETLREKLHTQSEQTPQAIIKAMDPYYILIDEWDNFYGVKKTNNKDIASLLQRAAGVGISLVVTATVGTMQGMDDLTRWIKQTKDGLLISQQGFQNIFPIPYGKDKIEMGEGLLFDTGFGKRLKLAKN